MNKIGRMLILMLVVFIAVCCISGRKAWANELSKPQLKVNDVAIDMKEKEPPVLRILEPRVKKGPRKWIVQFAGPIRQEDKEWVVNLGCRLSDYLPDFAFVATMDEATRNVVIKLPFVHGVTRFKPAHKLSAKLRERAIDPVAGERVRLHLKIDDVAQVADVLAVVHRLDGEVLDVGRDMVMVAIDEPAIAEQ